MPEDKTGQIAAPGLGAMALRILLAVVLVFAVQFLSTLLVVLVSYLGSILKILTAMALPGLSMILSEVGIKLDTNLVAVLFQERTWVSQLVNHTGMLVFSVFLIARVLKGDLAEDYGFKLPETLRGLLPGIGGAVTALLLGMGASFLQGALGGGDLRFLSEYDPLKKILLIWIYASTAEEILFRGLIQGFLGRFRSRGLRVGRLHLGAHILVGALLFALVHLFLLTMGTDPVTVGLIVVFALLIGLLAGWARERSGSIVTAVLIHALANVGGSLGSILG